MSTDDKKPSRLAKQLEIMGLGDGGIAEADLAAERRAMAAATPRGLVFPGADALGTAASGPHASDAGAARATGAAGPQTSDVGAARATGAAGLNASDAGAARATGASAARAAGVPNSPLSRRRVRAYYLPALGALAAAALTLFIFRNSRDNTAPFQVMGAGDVQVFSDVAGEVHALAADADLPAGARVKAAVLAPAASAAFWGVVTRDGKLLSDPAWIAQNRLALPAGERKFFGGSLALEGPSEGEILVVITCPAGVDAAGIAAAMSAPALPEAFSRCRAARVRLRR